MVVSAGVWRGILEEGAVVVEFLKRGRDSQQVASDDAQTRRVVETLIDDVAKHGDAAVRELSFRFDNWIATTID
jgi:histidinol dehydrogenase